MPLRYKWPEGTSKSIQVERESTDEDRNMDDNAPGTNVKKLELPGVTRMSFSHGVSTSDRIVGF